MNPYASFRYLFMPALLVAVLLPSATTVQANTTLPTNSIAATSDNTVMLTVFLKHDQSRPLGELKAQLAKQDFHKAFPPEGVEVVSWNITMGIGQVIVLRLPASRLAQVNLAIENTAWGVYKTEFFPTYDFMPIAQRERAQARQPGTTQ